MVAEGSTVGAVASIVAVAGTMEAMPAGSEEATAAVIEADTGVEASTVGTEAEATGTVTATMADTGTISVLALVSGRGLIGPIMAITAGIGIHTIGTIRSIHMFRTHTVPTLTVPMPTVPTPTVRIPMSPRRSADLGLQPICKGAIHRRRIAFMWRMAGGTTSAGLLLQLFEPQRLGRRRTPVWPLPSQRV